MAQIDTRERQLTIKLVYYGPPMSGKTTNLRCIHQRVHELNRGRLMTLDTRDDRTLFFDLLPIFFKHSGLSFRVKIYTVPGQPMHEATRRIVLQGADGIAFIADARQGSVAENNQSYANLLANISELGPGSSEVPVIVQFNKCDLPDALSSKETEGLHERSGQSAFRSSAINGEGVIETLMGLLRETWRSLEADMHLERSYGLGETEFLAAFEQHLGAPTLSAATTRDG